MYKNYIYLYNFFFNYPTPANLTNVWNFGIMAFGMLIFQIVTGIMLSFYYVPEEIFSFFFVERIMRDVSLGYVSRYLHANGASIFFFVVYLHFFRGLYYFSYISPKKLIWNTGVIVLVLMIATAFTGYVLPWGQMSFRACTVITSLATVFPVIGGDISHIVWGSYGVSTITLNRFYTLHFFLPFVIFFIMVLHFYYLHDVGSSNGTRIHATNDKMKFHPYYTWKDAVVFASMVTLYFVIVLLTPNYLNHADNALPANAMVTPMHIVPEWYFLPFYAILRSAPNKLAGIILMSFSIIILFMFPSFIENFYHPRWWNRAKEEQETILNSNAEFWRFVEDMSSTWTQTYLFWMFTADFVALAFIGSMPVERPYTTYGTYFTYIYFLFFFSSFIIHRINWYVIYTKGVIIPMYFSFILAIAYYIVKFVRMIDKFLNHVFPTFHTFLKKNKSKFIDFFKNTAYLNKVYKLFSFLSETIKKVSIQIIDWENEFLDNFKKYWLWIYAGYELSDKKFYEEKMTSLEWKYSEMFPSFKRKDDVVEITSLKDADIALDELNKINKKIDALNLTIANATAELNDLKKTAEEKKKVWEEKVDAIKKNKDKDKESGLK